MRLCFHKSLLTGGGGLPTLDGEVLNLARRGTYLCQGIPTLDWGVPALDGGCTYLDGGNSPLVWMETPPPPPRCHPERKREARQIPSKLWTVCLLHSCNRTFLLSLVLASWVGLI